MSTDKGIVDDVMAALPEEFKQPLRMIIKEVEAFAGKFGGGTVQFEDMINKLEKVSPKSMPEGEEVVTLLREIEMFDNLVKELEDDDGALAQPGCQKIQKCKKTYSASVKQRLGDYSRDLTGVVTTVKTEADPSVFGDMKKGVRSMQTTIPQRLKELQTAPKLVITAVEKALSNLDGMRELPNTLRAVMDQLDVDNLLEPLVGAVNHTKSNTVDKLRGVVGQTQEFIQGSPRQIDHVFGVPSPWTFTQPYVTKIFGRPPSQQRLYDGVSSISGMLDLSSVIEALEFVETQFSALQLDEVSRTFKDFSKDMRSALGKADKAAGVASRAAETLQQAQSVANTGQELVNTGQQLLNSPLGSQLQQLTGSSSTDGPSGGSSQVGALLQQGMSWF